MSYCLTFFQILELTDDMIFVHGKWGREREAMEAVCSKEDKNVILSTDLIEWEKLNHHNKDAVSKVGVDGVRIYYSSIGQDI